MNLLEIENVPSFNPVQEYNLLSAVKEVDINGLTYSNFFDKFLLKNVPCIIKNVSNSWQCTQNWIANKNINLSFMTEKYGKLDVPVAVCDDLKYNSQTKISMPFSQYSEYFLGPKEKILYLKDWHLRQAQTFDEFYTVPAIFSSDWLNEYAIDNEEDDFMFVYMGPKNSWTPLHVDVYHSYSWSVNVIGEKKWVLLPPGEEAKLKDNLGNLPVLCDLANTKNLNYYEVIQKKGDAIFVPSGWHHQVTNLVDTISINHNWINGCNINCVWNAMLDSLISVENEISDLKEDEDYNKQCQIILKSVFGMNCHEFGLLIKHIATKRLQELQGNCTTQSGKYQHGIKHKIFDLKNILTSIENMIQHPCFFPKYIQNDSLQNDLISLKTIIQKKLEYNHQFAPS